MVSLPSPAFTPAELAAEADRLLRMLLSVDCTPGRPWNLEACRRLF